MKDHLLIDVHDYSHIHNGPGIQLVAHEANFSLDQEGGRLGLLYSRKQPLAGKIEDRLAAALTYAMETCRLLEAEGLRFRDDELLFIANDRLQAPNDADTSENFAQAISTALTRSGRPGLAVTGIASSPKNRLSIVARSSL